MRVRELHSSWKSLAEGQGFLVDQALKLVKKLSSVSQDQGSSQGCIQGTQITEGLQLKGALAKTKRNRRAPT